ncbi:MAG: DUF975 family protein [Lachnobacterium sp.]|nr:DUF975 family protein [Lachnobacterium sp.]
MWNRAELKGKAKFSFKRNYWKSVLISLLLALIVGGGGTGAGSFSRGLSDGVSGSDESYTDDYDYNDGDYDDDSYDDESEYDIIRDFSNGFAEGFQDGASHGHSGTAFAALAIFGITFIIIFLILMSVVILLDVFICNPIEVGCKRFYVRNLNESAQIGNVGFAFDNHYKNITKTMFFRDLYTILWTLLFIIPGIVKSYEYQMIPYLLAENPQMSREQAFAESKRMMSGQKWRAFVLDLSFIGWNILSAITLGILGIFYVQPYMDATHAALYEALRYGTPYGAPMNDASNGFNGMPNGFNGAPNGFTNSATDRIVEENPNQ